MRSFFLMEKYLDFGRTLFMETSDDLKKKVTSVFVS